MIPKSTTERKDFEELEAINSELASLGLGFVQSYTPTKFAFHPLLISNPTIYGETISVRRLTSSTVEDLQDLMRGRVLYTYGVHSYRVPTEETFLMACHKIALPKVKTLLDRCKLPNKPEHPFQGQEALSIPQALQSSANQLLNRYQHDLEEYNTILSLLENCKEVEQGNQVAAYHLLFNPKLKSRGFPMVNVLYFPLP